jgi:hypothetical protein
MTINQAKRIGSRLALKSVGIGLLIANLIMILLFYQDMNLFKAFFWFVTVEYRFNLFITAIIMLLCGHYFGQIAGKLILIKRWNFIVVGFMFGITVLLTTALFSSWTGFIQEGYFNLGTNDNPFEDYIFKPLYWVALYGIFPSFVVGIWYGWKIKRHSIDKKNSKP